MSVNEYWPLDVAVALLWLALCGFCAFRGIQKLRQLVWERKITRDQLRQLGANQRTAMQLPSSLYPQGALAGADDRSGLPAALVNHSLLAASQRPVDDASFAYHNNSSYRPGAPASGGSPPTAGGASDPAKNMPPIWKDRRFRTVALLGLISVYAVSRAVFLFLGAFDAIPTDGSIKSHFASTIQALLFMVLQTALIARWSRHVRDSEMRLYARDFPVAGAAVWVSAALDVCVLLVTAFALVDIATNAAVTKGDMTVYDWNMCVAAVAGAVYIFNGLIFIALGCRLFWMWRTAHDPLSPNYQHRGGDAAHSDGGADSDSGTGGLTAGCTNNGQRGQRILGVAFVFGSMLVLRGLGLLSFVLQHYNHIDHAVHNRAAPALALLFELVMLVITLRLLMPPGTGDGDRDPNWAPSMAATSAFSESDGNYSGTVVDPLHRSGGGSRTEPMRASAPGLYDSTGRVPSRMPPGYGGSSPGNSPGVPHRRQGESRSAFASGKDVGAAGTGGGGGRGAAAAAPRGPPLRPQRSAWAGAHAVDGYHDDDGSNPNSSWRMVRDDDDDDDDTGETARAPVP